MFTTRLFCALTLGALSLGGCYSPDAALGDDTGSNAEEAVGTSYQRLVGAWVGDSGPFRGLVFTANRESRGHHFFTYVDNGIRCVRAPCPSESMAEGYFTASTRTVTLRPSPSVTFPTVQFGVYQYALSGEQLTLTQSGRVVARLHKVVSYCGDASECAEQQLIAPRCLGRWSCTAERACRYQCGRPVANEGETCGGIAGIACADGLTCVTTATHPDATGTCRAPSPTCANVRCAAGTHCEMVPVTCVRAPCPAQPQCVRNTTCAATTCAVGTRCDDSTGTARCVPAGPSCAAIRCASGYVCRETNGVGACVPQNRVCGNTVCGEGTTCCNPLRGICTPPGWACIQ